MSGELAPNQTLDTFEPQNVVPIHIDPNISLSENVVAAAATDPATGEADLVGLAGRVGDLTFLISEETVTNFARDERVRSRFLPPGSHDAIVPYDRSWGPFSWSRTSGIDIKRYRTERTEREERRLIVKYFDADEQLVHEDHVEQAEFLGHIDETAATPANPNGVRDLCWFEDFVDPGNNLVSIPLAPVPPNTEAFDHVNEQIESMALTNGWQFFSYIQNGLLTRVAEDRLRRKEQGGSNTVYPEREFVVESFDLATGQRRGHRTTMGIDTLRNMVNTAFRHGSLQHPGWHIPDSFDSGHANRTHRSPEITNWLNSLPIHNMADIADPNTLTYQHDAFNIFNGLSVDPNTNKVSVGPNAEFDTATVIKCAKALARAIETRGLHMVATIAEDIKDNYERRAELMQLDEDTEETIQRVLWSLGRQLYISANPAAINDPEWEHAKNFTPGNPIGNTQVSIIMQRGMTDALIAESLMDKAVMVNKSTYDAAEKSVVHGVVQYQVVEKERKSFQLNTDRVNTMPESVRHLVSTAYQQIRATGNEHLPYSYLAGLGRELGRMLGQ